MSKRIVRNIFENVNDENIALTSEISTKLSYKDLKLFINKISKQLAGNGLSNKDRAAIVLPNGPYMASSFLAISSYMSAAPLNPCLLYTSPSPRDLSTSRMPSSA